jgi:PKD repeat protein
MARRLALLTLLLPAVAFGQGMQTTHQMHEGRNNHGAMLLTDGRVLVVGGLAQGATDKTASAEIFDPFTGTWTPVASMPGPRARFTIVHLLDGRVAVIGGNDDDGPLDWVTAYDPHSDTWTELAPMNRARRSHAATRLPDGRIFVAGGRGAFQRAEVFDPAEGAAGVWREAGTLPEGRQNHSQVLLGDGDVLVIGGRDHEWTIHDVVHRFTPQPPGVDPPGTFQTLANLTYPRYDLSAIGLRDGLVLLADGAVAPAELYDASGGGAADLTGSPGTARLRAASVLLPDGRAFVVAGGPANASGRLATTEIYDPGTGEFSPGPVLDFPADRLVAVLLEDGRVLTVGGYFDEGAGAISLRSTQIAYPTGDEWWAGTPLLEARHAHAALLRPDGRIFAIGGVGASDAPLASVEFLDTTLSWPDWEPGPALTESRARPVALVLADGSLLVAGGEGTDGALESVERLPVGASAWVTEVSMSQPRTRHRAVLLSSGEALVIGGERADGTPTATVERFDPLAGTWRMAAPMSQARAGHTATLLADGRVLVTGGRGTGTGTAWIDSAEIYDPWNDAWSAAGQLPVARYDHRAVLLPRGRVLVTGGAGSGGPLSDAALFDPQTSSWVSIPMPGTGRRDHVLEVLPGGRVLNAHGQPTGETSATQTYDPASRSGPTGPDTGIWLEGPAPSTVRHEAAVVLGPTGWMHVIGGRSDTGTSYASTVLYTERRAYAHWSWRPVLAPLPASARAGELLALDGAGFTGIHEASFGGHMASPANHPVVTLRREGGGGIVRPLARAFDDGEVVLSLPETGMLSGWWWVSPTVAGVLGRGRAIFIRRPERLWTDELADVSMVAGGCYGPFAVQMVDPRGEPISRTEVTPLSLDASGGRLTFHNEADCSDDPLSGGSIAAGATEQVGFVRAVSAGETRVRIGATGLVPMTLDLVVAEDGEAPVDPDPPEEAPRILQEANPVGAVGHPYLYGPDRRAHAEGEGPFSWDVLEGPAGYVVDGRTGEVSWTPNTAGTVSITLEATNVHGADVYTYEVDVVEEAPAPPTPVLQVTPPEGSAPLSVALDGSESEAAPGSQILAWRWELGDGSGVRIGPTAAHTYLQPGGYVVRLTVWDQFGVSASGTAQVLATRDGAQPPSARIVASDIHSDGSLTTDLSCACFAGDEPIVAYTWDLGDGTVARSAEVRHTYGPGSHEVVLTVVDAGGLEATDRITLTISDGGVFPPVLVAQATPVAGEAPLEVTFVVAHTDPAGGSLTPEWTFDDGVALAGETVVRRYDDSGTRRATVTVTGATGLSSSRSVEVTVTGAEGRVRPQIVSLPRTEAVVGEAYAYDDTGRPLARGSRPLEWSLGKRVGEALVGAPDGMTVDPQTGGLDWMPGDEAEEVYVVLVARNDVGSAVQAWTIAVDGARAPPSDPSCECTSAGGGSIAWAFGLLLIAGSMRHSRRRKDALEPQGDKVAARA